MRNSCRSHRRIRSSAERRFIANVSISSWEMEEEVALDVHSSLPYQDGQRLVRLSLRVISISKPLVIQFLMKVEKKTIIICISDIKSHDV